jgi:hypothetical protein
VPEGERHEPQPVRTIAIASGPTRGSTHDEHRTRAAIGRCYTGVTSFAARGHRPAPG